MSDSDRERAIQLLNRNEGAKIPEISEQLNLSRERSRELVREIEAEYELGSSPDFRYKIVPKNTGREGDV